MSIELLPLKIRKHYEVHEWKHACAILKNDFPDEWADIIALVSNFKLCKSWITQGGGRKSKVSDAIDHFLYAKGWEEKEFKTSVQVDENVMDSPLLPRIEGGSGAGCPILVFGITKKLYDKDC